MNTKIKLETTYEDCEYYLVEDVTPWHSDVFDHPSYKSYCTKNGDKKELIYPKVQCSKCQQK